jgi:hypothetical protein
MSEDRYPTPPDNFPKSNGSGSGTDVAYSVEARLAYPTPRMVCGHLLDARWQRVEFEKSRTGIPVKDRLFPVHNTLGLFGYQAAQALRWWFLAQADVEFSCLCIETRLIEHKVQYSYSGTAERACAIIAGEKDRSHIMPEPAPK